MSELIVCSLPSIEILVSQGIKVLRVCETKDLVRWSIQDWGVQSSNWGVKKRESGGWCWGQWALSPRCHLGVGAGRRFRSFHFPFLCLFILFLLLLIKWLWGWGQCQMPLYLQTPRLFWMQCFSHQHWVLGWNQGQHWWSQSHHHKCELKSGRSIFPGLLRETGAV